MNRPFEIYTNKYGVKVRQNHAFIRGKAKKKYFCPKCGAESLGRFRAGLWRCNLCKLFITGNAYTPE